MCLSYQQFLEDLWRINLIAIEVERPRLVALLALASLADGAAAPGPATIAYMLAETFTSQDRSNQLCQIFGLMPRQGVWRALIQDGCVPERARAGGTRTFIGKSLLLLFFRKEHLAF